MIINNVSGKSEDNNSWAVKTKKGHTKLEENALAYL